MESTRILLHQPQMGLLDIGTTEPVEPEEALLEGYPFSISNSNITFKEMEFESQPSTFEANFTEQLEALNKLQWMLRHKTLTHEMTVGKFSSIGVELTPTDPLLQYHKFYLPTTYYQEQKEVYTERLSHPWYPLLTGDVIQVFIGEKDKSGYACTVQKVVQSVDTHKREYIQQGPLREKFYFGLRSMARHALLEAEVFDVQNETDEQTGRTFTNLRFKVGDILLSGTFNAAWMPIPLQGKIEVGSLCRLWVTESNEKGKEPGNVHLNAIGTHHGHFPRKPIHEPEQERTAVLTTISSYSNSGNILLWAICEQENPEETWGNNVFNNFLKSGMDRRRFASPNEWTQKSAPYIKLVWEYLPLGFPAQFTFDYSRSEQRERFLLRGFNPLLRGRVASDTEAQNLHKRILRQQVFMSPYHRGKGGANLISAEYSGWVSDSAMPTALINFCKHRVFTPEMQVPARVGIMNQAVLLDVNVALSEEKRRLQLRVGEQEQLKVCALLPNRAYLTTTGGYPIEYLFSDEQWALYFKRHIFQTVSATIVAVTDDVVSVNVESPFAERLSHLSIVLDGGRFETRTILVEDDIWHVTRHGVDCYIVPESLNEEDMPQPGLQCMMVGANSRGNYLVAVAHPEHFERRLTEPTRLTTIRQLTDQTWLCHQEDELWLMKVTSAQAALLRHLQRLYGKHIPLMAEPFPEEHSTTSATQCCFSGVACGADYKALFSQKPFQPAPAISKETPRVLWADAVLTASEEELQKGPITSALLTGEIDDMGALLCRHANQSVLEQSGSATNDSHPVMAIVQDVADGIVCFKIGDEKICLQSREELHLPIKRCDLTEIFTPGSSWAVRKGDNGGWQLNNDYPLSLTRYTLVAPTTTTQRRSRNDRQWVVRSEAGFIAVAVISNGIAGDQLLLIGSEESIDDDVTEVFEADSLIMGHILTMRLKGHDAYGEGFLAESIKGLTLAENYLIPSDLWNWSLKRLPIIDTSPIEGCAFMARVIDINEEQERVTLDRQCLLAQCELQAGELVDGDYQMVVEGICKEGYLLSQNGVHALLPWDESSLFGISTDITFRQEYLRKGTLLKVRLDYITDPDGNLRLQAKWKSTKDDIIQKWRKEPEGLTAVVDHIGIKYLFVSIDGIIMYLPSNKLQLWEGTPLENHFQRGQVIDRCRIIWRKDTDTFGITIDAEELPHLLQPDLSSKHRGIVIRYKSPNKNDLYVQTEHWTAIVPEKELSWEPLPEGRRPFEIGQEIDFIVQEINMSLMLIKASIRACFPKPDWSQMEPELRWFTLPTTPGAPTEIGSMLCLQDSNQMPGLLSLYNACIAKNLSGPMFAEIVERMLAEKGMWMAVKGLQRPHLRYCCSLRIIKEALKELHMQIHNQPDGQLLHGQVRILAVKNNRLVVALGMAVGRINQRECTGQTVVPLNMNFHVGQNIDCVFLQADIEKGEFIASIIRTLPQEEGSLFGGIRVGDVETVTILGGNQRAAKVAFRKKGVLYAGFIQQGEADHDPNTDMEQWGQRYAKELLSVECISINIETGEILFSRKRRLAAPDLLSDL